MIYFLTVHDLILFTRRFRKRDQHDFINGVVGVILKANGEEIHNKHTLSHRPMDVISYAEMAKGEWWKES